MTVEVPNYQVIGGEERWGKILLGFHIEFSSVNDDCLTPDYIFLGEKKILQSWYLYKIPFTLNAGVAINSINIERTY